VTIIDPTDAIPGQRRATTRKPGPLLEVRDLHVDCFQTRRGVVKAVNGVKLLSELGRRSPCSRVGSGKSVTAQAIMGILDMPPARIPQARSASTARTC